MDRYRVLVRMIFALVFLAGGLSHVALGRLNPAGYAVFGHTAWLPWLGDLWSSFVMPHIGWLTIAAAVFEIAVGVGLLVEGRPVTVAALATLAFFVFLLVLGYGFPTENLADDLTKNRVFTAVMAALLAPVLTRSRPPGIVAACCWRARDSQRPDNAGGTSLVGDHDRG